MKLLRPKGFHQFIRRNEFHSIYLASPESLTPVKIGIADDPKRRIRLLHDANFVPIHLYRSWWVAGRPISSRVEQACKKKFVNARVQGEWFDVAIDEIAEFVGNTLKSLNAWSISDEEMIDTFERAARRRGDSMYACP